MKSVIIDFHAGCIESLYNSIHSELPEVRIASFSGHNKYLSKDATAALLDPVEYVSLRNALFPELPDNEPPSIQSAVKIPKSHPMATTPTFDIAFVMFPPAMYRRILKSGIANQIVVIASHRMDLWIQNPILRRKFWDQLKKDIGNKKVTLRAASQYDAKYIEYYTGVKVEVIAPYIEIGVMNEVQYRNEFLIGPSNIDLTNPKVATIKNDLGLRSIKEEYENASLDKLNAHRGFVVLPYSTYSISLLELMAMGKYLLVPTDNWLIANKLLNDVRLYPIYGRVLNILLFEFYAFLRSGKPCSPNSPFRKDRLVWASYASWHEYENLVQWSSIIQLKRILSEIMNIEPASQLTQNSLRKKRFEDLIRTVRQSSQKRIP